MTPLLDVSDLTVRIGSSQILHSVGLTVAHQGVTALLGRNGAGKTTTLKAVLGLVPRTGRVRLGDEELSALPTHAIVRRGLGYAPEDRNVFASLTVTENLQLAARGSGPHHYDLVYDMFPELKTRGRQRAGSLSGGQQQMVAIGRTLLNDNRLLLVDEPTKGLAPKIVTEVADVLARAAQKVPILLVEQNLALVRRIADHTVVLEQGSVVHTSPAADLLTDGDLTRELLGVA
ncbi:ABC transporter ATP-binding protein [Streptomyces sp. YC504]|uniref:ABC transporter ATP-binding protein n=1 Tax=Streptomyces mesophilus TaxID=1775132 RepID=A0A6G4XMU4_9ACTN|nr:ABC transporter ATP-binding protein [Streptomyces mesophilus]NGO78896.1 ABC transporter ATP-binding protein [Streptomyces mesophilus]